MWRALPGTAGERPFTIRRPTETHQFHVLRESGEGTAAHSGPLTGKRPGEVQEQDRQEHHVEGGRPGGHGRFLPGHRPAASSAPYGRGGSRTGGWNLNGDRLVQDRVPRSDCFPCG